MKTSRQKLVAILQETRELLSRPDNDFAWSSWEDATAALRETDGLIASIESGDLPDRSDIEVLFLPTGPIQEVSLSSDWGQQFLTLASRSDSALQSVYGRHPREIASHKAALAGQFHELFGGRLRWFCSVLFLLSTGFLVHLTLTKEPVEVYFPIHLQDHGVWWATLFAAAVFGILAVINWFSHLKPARK